MRASIGRSTILSAISTRKKTPIPTQANTRTRRSHTQAKILRTRSQRAGSDTRSFERYLIAGAQGLHQVQGACNCRPQHSSLLSQNYIHGVWGFFYVTANNTQPIMGCHQGLSIVVLRFGVFTQPNRCTYIETNLLVSSNPPASSFLPRLLLPVTRKKGDTTTARRVPSISAGLGAIYKLSRRIQLGLAFTTHVYTISWLVKWSCVADTLKSSLIRQDRLLLTAEHTGKRPSRHPSQASTCTPL